MSSTLLSSMLIASRRSKTWETYTLFAMPGHDIFKVGKRLWSGPLPLSKHEQHVPTKEEAVNMKQQVLHQFSFF